jgi:hypothetical protein
MEPITLTDCKEYREDPCICDDTGEPKGQCANCGYKWFEHKLEALPVEEQESALALQEQKGIKTS